MEDKPNCSKFLSILFQIQNLSPEKLILNSSLCLSWTATGKDKHRTWYSRCTKPINTITGWPHFSQNEIPCVFPEFSLCYRNFPVIFMQKLTISSMNKGHIATVLLHTEAYKLIFKVWII